MKHPAVFLDRDGTLIEEVGYPTRPEQIRILGGAARALQRLAEAGYRLVVVTNQSAIARGLMTEDDLNRFHQALDEQLDVLGARINAYYTCPHHPDAAKAQRPELAVDCDCRKPKPGMLLWAARDMDLDLAASWIVGDLWRDIQAGHAAGVRTIKIPAPPHLDEPRPADCPPPTAEAAGLDQAADLILARAAREPAAGAAGDLRTGSPAAPAAGSQPAPPPAAPEEVAPAPPAPPRPPEPVAAAPTPEVAGEAPHEIPEPAAEPAPIRSATAPARAAAAARPASGPPAEVPAESPAAEAPAASPPPAEPPAATCARCGQGIPVAEIVSGAAERRDGNFLCAECLAHHTAQDDDRLPSDTAGLLRAILTELQRQHRRRADSLSFFRLLAYLVQAATLFCGFLGLVSTGPERAAYLQAAIFLQLLVLTLLLFERHS